MVEKIGEIKKAEGKPLLKIWEVTVANGIRTFQRHSHVQFEISMVMNGDGIYTTESQIHQISKGDFFVFSSNETHCITKIGKNGLKLINLHIEPQYFWGRSIDSLSEQNINLCFFHSKKFNNHIPSDKAGNLKDIINKIVLEFNNKSPEYELIIKSLINFLVVSLIRNYDYTASCNSLSQSHLKAMRHAVTYIDSHLTEKISLNTMADLVGVTPNYFSHLFHKFSNMRFQDYINSRRIEKSTTYLTEIGSQKSIIEIATICGFNNTANFNKAFKKFTGITPHEYRSLPNFQLF